MKKPNLRALCFEAWIVGVIVIPFVGMAQELVLPTHEVPAPDVATEVLRREQPRTGMFKAGPFDITPRVSASVYYDDNIDTDPAGTELDSMVFTLAPTISAIARDMAEGQGKSLSLRYTPLFYLYFDENDYNRVNHSASLSGQLGTARLALGFDQSFRFSTDPVVDIGGQADRYSYQTTLSSSYALGEKTSIEVNGGIQIEDYDRYSNYKDFSNNDWIAYQYSPKLGLGLGLVFGYLAIEDLPDQTYQQALARVGYALAEKVDLLASAGGEWRQYRSGVDDTLNPVWNVAAVYRPRESSTLSLVFYQRITSSAFYGDQNYMTTGVTLSARQMLLRRLALNLSGTFYYADYESTVQGISADRTDKLWLARVSVDYYLRPRWTAGVFFDYQTRDSSGAGFGFDRTRVGVQSAWTY